MTFEEALTRRLDWLVWENKRQIAVAVSTLRHRWESQWWNEAQYAKYVQERERLSPTTKEK